MIEESGPLTFALTLKRWFASNDWPQKITDDWAKDPGVMNPHGPWASQMCGAMKAAGYNPKVDFFLALAEFNRFIAAQELKGVVSTRLRDRLDGAKPICLEDGTPYSAPDFWSLYAGLIEPPAEFARQPQQLTQEDVEEWARQSREAFRQLSLKHMVSKGEAWEMLKDRMMEMEREAGKPASEMHDCLDWMQEVLAGFREPTVEEAIRQAKRWQGTQPFQKALEELLGEKKTPSTV